MTSYTEEEYISDIYTSWHKPILRRAYSLLHNWDDADDAVSEAWRRFVVTARVKPIELAGGWLLTTVKRIAFDMLKQRRKRWQRQTAPTAVTADDGQECADWEGIPGPDDVEGEVVNLAETLRLQAIIDEVSAEFPNWMGLMEDVFAGLTHAEIAERRGETEEAIGARIFRLRRRLWSVIDPVNHPPRVGRERTPASQTSRSEWYAEAAILREQGWSIQAIADKFGRSWRSVHTALKKQVV